MTDNMTPDEIQLIRERRAGGGYQDWLIAYDVMGLLLDHIAIQDKEIERLENISWDKSD